MSLFGGGAGVSRADLERGLRACVAAGVAFTGLLVPVEATAQDGEHERHEHARHGASGHESPYAAYGEREIMALSPEEIDGLRAGEGMGMAVPAELHGYPGPRHVLELASELELTRSQVEATKTVFDSMATRARALGREIVELERDLDAAFEEGTVTHEELDRLVGEIARRRAELRTVHLGAHLELRPVLTEEQRDAYDRIRGYDD